MQEQTITVTLPPPLLDKLKRAAKLTYRSIDEVVASTIDAALIAPPDLPDDLAGELAAMRLLSDQALQAATYPSLSPADQERLRQLNHIAGERALTAAESAEQMALLDAYQRAVVRRAQALAILVERGYRIEAGMLAPVGGDDE